MRPKEAGKDSMKNPLLPVPTESAEQQALIRWWSLQRALYSVPAEVLMACPAQAMRTARNGARMKAEGYRTGTPDLFLAVARGQFHGLFIEIKRTRHGVLSDEQRDMLNRLKSQGYCTAVCKGFDEAKRVIEWYLT